MGCGASLPSAAEFLRADFPAPEKQYGNLPCDKVVTLKVKQKFFSLRGDFIVKDTEGASYCKVVGVLASMRTRVIIKDMDDNPIACVIEKIMSMSPAMFIYGFKPYFEGQNPVSETQNDLPLYAWAKVWKPLKSITSMLCVQMANGDDSYTEASFGTADYKAKAPSMTAPRLSVVKGADMGANGCALIDRSTIQFEGMNVYDVRNPRLERTPQLARAQPLPPSIQQEMSAIAFAAPQVTVAKGIDPILIVGMTICKDKIEEKES